MHSEIARKIADKRVALGLSLFIHVLIIVLVKPQRLDSLSDVNINFNSGKLIINAVLNGAPKHRLNHHPKNVPAQRDIIKGPSTKKAVTLPTKNVAKSTTPTTQNFEKSILTNLTPHYPRIALKRGWQGFVKIRLTIAADGKVTGIDIIEKNAHQLLVDSALKAARQWLFKASPEGRHYRVEKRIVFQLKL